jgi:hypothetical protein
VTETEGRRIIIGEDGLQVGTPSVVGSRIAPDRRVGRSGLSVPTRLKVKSADMAQSERQMRGKPAEWLDPVHGLYSECDDLATNATIAGQNKAAMGQRRVF